MYAHTVFIVSFVASAFAAPACATAIYKPPKTESFMTIDMKVSYTVNVTTHEGAIGIIPIVSGNLTGKFNGHLVPNLSSATERLLPGSDGANSVSTAYQAGCILFHCA